MAKHGQSIILASILALLSYVPFEIVAKTTLIFCALIFVFDPIPPLSRLIALIGIAVVGLLGRIERTWREGQIEETEGSVGSENQVKNSKSRSRSRSKSKKED